MIKILTIHKPGVRDHEGVFHGPFMPFPTSNKHFAWLTGRSPRSIYEVDTLADMIRSERTSKSTVRQMARNAGLVADDDLDSVRSRLLVLIGAVESPGPEVKTVLTPAPAPAPIVEPTIPDEPSEPLVPAGSIKDEAWDRLRAAFLAQDFRETRSALAALSDEPTPSKATELWPKVEQLLRDHNLITDADL